jgi:hypothetical protein
MLALLGANVGDHLQAAVDNVVEGSPQHFEQALFADGLSDATLAWLGDVVRAQWKAVRLAVVPELEARLEADGQVPGALARRWRLGLYSYDEVGSAPAPSSAGAPTAAALPTPRAAAPRSRTRKTLK